MVWRRVDVVVEHLHECMPFVRTPSVLLNNIVHFVGLVGLVGEDQCHKKAVQTANNNVPPSPLVLYHSLVITPDAS